MNVYWLRLSPEGAISLDLDVIADTSEQAVEKAQTAVRTLYSEVPFGILHEDIRNSELVFRPSRIDTACIRQEFREVKPLHPKYQGMLGYSGDVLECARELFDRFITSMDEIVISSERLRDDTERHFFEVSCSGDPIEYLQRHFAHFLMHSGLEPD